MSGEGFYFLCIYFIIKNGVIFRECMYVVTGIISKRTNVCTEEKK